MTPIKQILNQFKSMYAAGKHYGLHPTQLKRAADTGALVDENGQVWVKGKIKLGDKG